MSMAELLKTRGTYMAARYSQASADKLTRWCLRQQVPKYRTEVDRLHTTLLYSNVEVNLSQPLLCENEMLDVYTKDLVIWDTTCHRSGNTAKALILLLDAPHLVAMHNTIRKETGATHCFDDYIPHITLSYDIGNIKLKKFDALPRMKLQIVSFESAELLP